MNTIREMNACGGESSGNGNNICRAFMENQSSLLRTVCNLSARKKGREERRSGHDNDFLITEVETGGTHSSERHGAASGGKKNIKTHHTGLNTDFLLGKT